MTIEWTYHKISELNLNNEFLINIHNVFLNAFGLENGWSLEGIKRKLQQSDLIGLLIDRQNIVGYGMFQFPDKLLLGKNIVWENSIAVKKEYQNKGFSNLLFRQIVNSNMQIKWIGGRTQNPLIINRYAKFGCLFPFDNSYNSVNGKMIIEYLLANIRQLFNLKIDEYGICKNLYSEGKLGDYEINPNDKFEKQLNQFNFQRLNGDCIIILTELNDR